MLTLIRNTKVLDTNNLKSVLKTHNITTIYEQTKYNDPQINRFIKENSANHTWLLIIDSQVEPIDLDLPFIQNAKASVIGGLILSHTNEPMWNNYGPETNMPQLAYAEALKKAMLHFWNDDEIAPKLRKYIRQNINYSTDFQEPKETITDWVSELFMFVRVKDLLTAGGIDINFKEFHIGPDICKRIRTNKGKVMFTPKLKAKLKEIPEQGKAKKHNYYLEDTIYWYQKNYGIDKKTFMEILYIKEVFEW